MAVSMSVPTSAMAVSMLMEQEKTDDVGCKSEAADDEDQLRIGDFLRLDEPLDSFEEDGKTQGDQEYSIDQRTKGFGALPLVLR